MSGELILAAEKIETRSNKELRRFWRVLLSRKVVVFGFIVIILFVLTAIFAPYLASYHPTDQHWDKVLNYPSREHPLGTDYLGRDTLSRLIYGTRSALMVGIVAISISGIAGTVLGLTAGYFGGFIQTIIMRVIDALMAFPMLLLALLISALLGAGLQNVMFALSVALIPGYARVMCGMVLSAKEAEYVTATRSFGANHARLMFRHILPNCIAPLIVTATMQIGATILAEAGLSYLGIGIKPPTPAWGAMVNDGYRYIATHPLLSFIPGFAIMLVVFAFNMVGDGLRDALDPRLRGVL